MNANKKYPSSVTFTRLGVKFKDYILVSSVFDDRADDPQSRIWIYDDGDCEWTFLDFPFETISISLVKVANQTNRSQSVLLSNEGHLFLFGLSGIQSTEEDIPGAGVFSDGAEGIGYMTALKQIGEHLYACGGRGQVYKRLGPDQWIRMDEGIRQSVDTPLDECHHLMDIHGLSEDAIYVSANHGKVLFWNGKTWTQVETPCYADLGKIWVDSPDLIWIAGSDGALLRGNARDGFNNVSPVKDLLFTDLVRHEGTLYLSCHLGLYTFDEKTRRMKRVKTGLKPEHTDTHSLDTKEGALWSVGSKDVVRFYEGKWKRIPHADNPPIQ